MSPSPRSGGNGKAFAVFSPKGDTEMAQEGEKWEGERKGKGGVAGVKVEEKGKVEKGKVEEKQV
jgi:hypothetical protein